MFTRIKRMDLLEYFFDEPFTECHLRGIARAQGMDPAYVKRGLDELVRDGLVLRRRQGNMVLFKANLANLVFRQLKIAHNLEFLAKKRAVDFTLSRLSGVSSIVLFGSYAKGENGPDSDVDMVVVRAGGDLAASALKTCLKRDVNILLFTPAEWSRKARDSRPFYLDVITTGIQLHGLLPVED